eukprot:maker-scaffold_15-snap-gene-3.24-mRNA-1 protein AED:0.37 eAED:0.37 QI:0/0/0/0.4/1/1/5/0/1274
MNKAEETVKRDKGQDEEIAMNLDKLNTSNMARTNILSQNDYKEPESFISAHSNFSRTQYPNDLFDVETLKKAVLEHALYLGMDPDEDEEFLPLAEEALLSELPEEWDLQPYIDVSHEKSDKGDHHFVYVNKITGKTSWENPLDEKYRQEFQRLKRQKEKHLLLENTLPEIEEMEPSAEVCFANPGGFSSPEPNPARNVPVTPMYPKDEVPLLRAVNVRGHRETIFGDTLVDKCLELLLEFEDLNTGSGSMQWMTHNEFLHNRTVENPEELKILLESYESAQGIQIYNFWVNGSGQGFCREVKETSAVEGFDMHGLVGKMEEKERRIKSLVKDLRTAMEDKETAEGLNLSLKEDFEDFQSKIVKLEKENNRLKTSHNRPYVKKLQQELDGAKDKIVSLRKSLREVETTGEKYRERIRSLELDIASERARVQKVKSNFIDEISMAKARTLQIEDELKKKGNEVIELEAWKKSSILAEQHLHAKLEELESKMEKVYDDKKSLELANTELLKSTDASSKQQTQDLLETKKTLNEFTAQMHMLRQELESLQAEKEQIKSSEETAKLRVSRLREENLRLIEENNKQTDLLTRAMDDYETAKQQHIAMKAEFNRLKANYRDSEQSCKELREDLQKQVRDKENLKKELVGKTQNLIEVTQFKASLKEAQDELAALEVKYTEMIAEKKNLQEALIATQNELSGSKREVKDLKNLSKTYDDRELLMKEEASLLNLRLKQARLHAAFLSLGIIFLKTSFKREKKVIFLRTLQIKVKERYAQLLKEEVLELEQGRTSEIQNLSEIVVATQNMKNELQLNEEKMENLRLQKECAETNNLKLQEEIENLKGAHFKSRKLNEEFQKNVGRLIGENINLARQCEEIKDSINIELEIQKKTLAADHRTELASYKERVLIVLKQRRDINTELLDLKGRIRVFCRVKPGEHQSKQLEIRDTSIRKTDDLDTVSKTFEFDELFPASCQQENIYDSVEPLIQSFLDGFNVCIFAYGQTGSGKTHTMDGNEEAPGVITRALETVIKDCEDSMLGKEKSLVDISVLEIYNEKVFDLLDDTSKIKKTSLNLKRLANGQVGVEGLSKHVIYSPEYVTSSVMKNLEHAKKLLARGRRARASGSHKLNQDSSRSHLIVVLRRVHPVSQESNFLYLVDLAGSERAKRTKSEGKTFDESRSINASLFHLGTVISKLQLKKETIDYRSSKLTHYLSNALKGESKVLLILCISAQEEDMVETKNSLEFGERCKQVALDKSIENARYKKKLIAMSRELKRLRKGGA